MRTTSSSADRRERSSLLRPQVVLGQGLGAAQGGHGFEELELRLLARLPRRSSWTRSPSSDPSPSRIGCQWQLIHCTPLLRR